MRRRLNCISLLLLLGVLLAALSPAAVVAATARGETLMAASGRDHAGAVDSSGHAPEEPPLPAKAAVASDGEDVIGTTRKDEAAAVRSHRRRFRTRKVPAASQVYFGGRIPFTADYHSVHRHPPTHN